MFKEIINITSISLTYSLS